jgi:hypothetical protein
METQSLVDDEQWSRVLERLPAGYEETAVSFGAIQRRRQIRSGGDLVRLAMGYAVCDRSLRSTAVWASTHQSWKLSSVAVLKRLRQGSEWFGWLVLESLAQREGLSSGVGALIRVVDATVVSEPGSRGTNWRLHMVLDLVREQIRSVELTGREGGEKLTRHPVVPGEILMGDQGYSHRQGVSSVLERGGHVVVRLNWQNFPAEDQEGQRIVLPQALEHLPVGQIHDQPVWFCHGRKRYKVRLVAYRKTAEPTPEALRQIKYRAAHKKRNPHPQAALASCFIFILTDLPAESCPSDQVLALYRLRWRIETAFKQLKSVLDLDQLRAHDPKLVATYIYTKLLAAIILEDLMAEAQETPGPGSGASPPCGTGPRAPAHPQQMADAGPTL